MFDVFAHPWPWYVAGPLVGLFVPALLVLGNRQFGISSNLRHLCAAVAPARVDFFRYDWRNTGMWNLAFLAGIFVGGFIGARLLGTGDVAITSETKAMLTRLGVHDFSGLAPSDIFQLVESPDAPRLGFDRGRWIPGRIRNRLCRRLHLWPCYLRTCGL